MKKSLLFLSIIITLSLPKFALGLEVDFPSVGGQKPTDSFSPAQWINYIFLFGLAVVGLAIIYTLVRAGFSWMTAGGGNEGAVKEARDRIKGAVVGLVILLGSVIFLNLINPNLTILKSHTIQFVGEWDYLKALFGKGSAANFCTYYNECKGGGECLTQAGKKVEPGEFGLCSTFTPQEGAGSGGNDQGYGATCIGGKNDCLRGLFCADTSTLTETNNDQQGKCAIPDGKGVAPINSFCLGGKNDCASGLKCIDNDGNADVANKPGVCKATTVSQSANLQLGTVCDPMQDLCDTGKNLTCKLTLGTDQATCQPK